MSREHPTYYSQVVTAQSVFGRVMQLTSSLTWMWMASYGERPLDAGSYVMQFRARPGATLGVLNFAADPGACGTAGSATWGTATQTASTWGVSQEVPFTVTADGCSVLYSIWNFGWSGGTATGSTGCA